MASCTYRPGQVIRDFRREIEEERLRAERIEAAWAAYNSAIVNINTLRRLRALIQTVGISSIDLGRHYPELGKGETPLLSHRVTRDNLAEAVGACSEIFGITLDKYGTSPDSTTYFAPYNGIVFGLSAETEVALIA